VTALPHPRPRRTQPVAIVREAVAGEPQRAVRRYLTTLPAKVLDRPGYARPLRPKWVNRLVREWRDDEAGTLIVSQRDGRYYLVAGNHRWAAVLQKGEPEFPFDCQVFEGLTEPEEARIYLAQDVRRLRHSAADDFQARLTQGDPIARGVKAVLDDLGLEVSPYGEAGFAKNRIRAVAGLLKSYEVNGRGNLHLALRLLRDEWGEEAPHLLHRQKTIYSEAGIVSLSTFLRLYGSSSSPLDVPKLRAAMRREGLAGWETRFNAQRLLSKTRALGGVATLFGILAWIDLYNHNRRTGNRLNEAVARTNATKLPKLGGGPHTDFYNQTKLGTPGRAG
jgi:hypothetical protein